MKKTVRLLQKICRVLELVVAIFVLLGIMTAIISLLKDDIRIFEEVLNDMTAFRHYLEKIFVLVIGIEFLEMLCHPNSDNVIQVLIFLVARHRRRDDAIRRFRICIKHRRINCFA